MNKVLPPCFFTFFILFLTICYSLKWTPLEISFQLNGLSIGPQHPVTNKGRSLDEFIKCRIKCDITQDSTNILYFCYTHLLSFTHCTRAFRKRKNIPHSKVVCNLKLNCTTQNIFVTEKSANICQSMWLWDLFSDVNRWKLNDSFKFSFSWPCVSECY